MTSALLADNALLHIATTLRVSGIVEESVVDGPGLRYVVFVQGCLHACRGCQNPETHNPMHGYTTDIHELFVKFTTNPLLIGITLSGGEPFLQATPLCQLAKQVKALGKSVVVYTGYTFETLYKCSFQDPAIAELLNITDTLIDGPYVESLRDLTLTFRGSRNQRILDRDAMHILATSMTQIELTK